MLFTLPALTTPYLVNCFAQMSCHCVSNSFPPPASMNGRAISPWPGLPCPSWSTLLLGEERQGLTAQSTALHLPGKLVTGLPQLSRIPGESSCLLSKCKYLKAISQAKKLLNKMCSLLPLSTKYKRSHLKLERELPAVQGRPFARLGPQTFGMLKQGKIIFALDLSKRVSPRTICKDIKKIDMTTGLRTMYRTEN